MKKKLFVFDDPGYARPFETIYEVVFSKSLSDFQEKFEESDTVLFTGGSDVSPFLYRDVKHTQTFNDPERDRFEVMVFDKAVAANKTILGICRGAQFACVKAGGKLFQDVTGHTQSHKIEDVFGNQLMMTSTHHQMMRPVENQNVVKIAWTKIPLSRYYEDGTRVSLYEPYKYEEPEILFFPNVKALAIQGHPEISQDKNLHSYCCDLVKYYLFDEKSVTPAYIQPEV